MPTSVSTEPETASTSVIRARPKSRILTTGRGMEAAPGADAASSVTTMLEGLRSRWMTPRWWA